MLDRLRPDTGAKTLAGRLYRGLMERARAPVFYLEFGVADTIDGRFDLVALHAWLVLDRLASRLRQILRRRWQTRFSSVSMRLCGKWA